MNEELKPCPFCGRKDRLNIDHYKSDGEWFSYVECEKCMANGPVGRQTIDAIDAWNRRAGESEWMKD